MGMGGIERLAGAMSADLMSRLPGQRPGQRKTQRGKLALRVATMPEVRSANLMDLTASLPRPSERHQVVMGAVRVGGRALPLAWRVKQTRGAIGFAEQRPALGHRSDGLGLQTRGFGLKDSYIRQRVRLDHLVLVMALALYGAVSTGMWDAVDRRTPAKKNVPCNGRETPPERSPRSSPEASDEFRPAFNDAGRNHPSGVPGQTDSGAM